jgi:hypothetical protein
VLWEEFVEIHRGYVLERQAIVVDHGRRFLTLHALGVSSIP